MGTKSTPAVKFVEATRISFRLLEYVYDPSAEAVGLQAAEALGLSPKIVFKTLIATLDNGEFVCVVIPSDARLNMKALATAAGAKRADMADAAKAERSSGYVVGGISPLGQRKKLRTLIDASANGLTEMVVNGGRRGLQIALKPADLIKRTNATVHALAVD
jgi:Cys-tRNA(Pro)/Cys-tRNA(Cys) deacylase